MLFVKTVNEDKTAFGVDPANTSYAVDLGLLNSLGDLQSDDGSDLIVELIDLYLEDAPQRIRAMRKAAAASEWVLLKQAAHNLKGSSSSLGVRHVAEICEKLEVTVAADSPAGVDALVQLLEYRFGKARQALATERQRRLG